MKIVFVSNYLNHHQLPLCMEMRRAYEGDFYFVADIPILPERIALGYPDLNSAYDFVIRPYEDEVQRNFACKVIDEADVVLLGSASLSYVKNRLKKRKITFLYSERIYKQGYQAWKLPVRIIKHYLDYSRHESFYLLCASAYASGDYAKTGAFLNKAYRWGYFPEVKRYENVDQLIAAKEPASILWVGRFVDWKYPDHAIRLALRLKEAGYRFKLRMIGTGELDEQLRQMVTEQQLEDVVEFLGSVKAEEVRQYMENSQMYLFTSGQGEGWGAVLNEAMNSGCAVVASSCAGSTPFLIRSGENGFSYDNINEEQLYQHVCALLENPHMCDRMGKNAYETMTGLWNAECAVQRFVELCEALLQGQRMASLFESGPCSKASIIKD